MTAEAEKWKQLPEEHLARSTKLPWYCPDFEYKLKPPFRKLLEEWSGIPPNDVVAHIYRVVSRRPEARRGQTGIKQHGLTRAHSARKPGRSSPGHA